MYRSSVKTTEDCLTPYFSRQTSYRGTVSLWAYKKPCRAFYVLTRLHLTLYWLYIIYYLYNAYQWSVMSSRCRTSSFSRLWRAIEETVYLVYKDLSCQDSGPFNFCLEYTTISSGVQVGFDNLVFLILQTVSDSRTKFVLLQQIILRWTDAIPLIKCFVPA